VPELPEVKAHAERLEQAFGEHALQRFEPLSFVALKTFSPPPESAYGLPLQRVGDRGKYLLLHFGTTTFVVHLMQGGRLKTDTSTAKRPRNGVARWHFDDGRRLLLTEAGTEHKAGVWVTDADPLKVEPLVTLGPNADQVTRDELAAALRASATRLHTFLRDQHAVAGLGRRLANEICHRVRLSPFAQTRSLTDEQIARLHVAMADAIAEGLAFERARDDMSSSKERPGQVHHRTGEPCPVCGDHIREVTYRSYTVHYCATCQTAGKVLADNTTSKFLK
jgi:formamidopyrimidine-DNA glycosylase